MYRAIAFLIFVSLFSASAQFSGPGATKFNSDNPSVDAFGKFRVSNSKLLFESKLQYDKAPYFWSEFTNSASTSIHSNENASVYLAINDTNGIAIRQTKRRFPYQPGKSQSILMTGVIGDSTGVLSRIGYFISSTNTPFDSALDGLYFQNSNGIVSVNVAKRLSDSQSEITSIPQPQWNIDPLNGKGPSKVIADWTKTQIFAIDFEWLGVGSIRYGVVVDGNIYYVHRINNANERDSVYMRTANHPLRYEIRSIGGVGELQQICATVNSEGGESYADTIRYLNSNATPQTLGDGLIRGLIGIKYDPQKTTSDISIKDVATLNPAGNNVAYQWMVLLNPSYTNASGVTQTWNSINGDSILVSTNFTYVAQIGTVLASGFGSSLSQVAGGLVENALKLGVSIDGVLDEIWLVARKLGSGGNDPTINASIGIKEIQ